jgi:hypothetical protein
VSPQNIPFETIFKLTAQGDVVADDGEITGVGIMFAAA